MKEMVLAILLGALGTVPKGQVKKVGEIDISGRIIAIQTTALQKSARILKGVLETKGDFLLLKL